jgi:nitroreductase
MELFEVIQSRRSVRNYEPVDIPREHLEKIAEAGRLAPSGHNAQPLEYILVTDPELIAQLARVQRCVGEASAVVAVVADPEASNLWLEDASAAVENMLLAIVDLGYASVWIEGTLQPKEEWAKDLLEVPINKRLPIMLPIGKTRIAPAPKEKKPLAELLHWNKYAGRI